MLRHFENERLLVASHNKGKIAEISDLFAPFGIAIVSAADHGLPEPIETETTFEGNALLKARAACHATGLPALSDDSGIAIDALDGAPGVYTADWAKTATGRDFTMAMEKAHALLMHHPQPWTARFISVLALVWPDGREMVFRGECTGRVIWPMRGSMGFGYDPIFVPEAETRTFAELDRAEKQTYSHRARAFAALLAFFDEDRQ